MKQKSKYYNIREILSTHRLLNFIVGQRSIGKTVSAKNEAVSRYLKRKEINIKNGDKHDKNAKFFYLRRYKEDIEYIIREDNFWGFVGEEYAKKGIELSQQKDKLYLGEEHIGTMISFSQYQRLKSGEYDNYGYFIFDEFIADDDTYKKDEVKLFANMLHSIARVRDSQDIQFVLIANSIKLMNPYFTEFGVIPNPTKDITLYKGIAIQMCKNYHEFSQDMLNETEVGAVVGRLKSYREMAFNNSFKDDNSINIEQKPRKAKHMFYFKKDGEYYGFWSYSNKMYVSRKYQPNCPYSFAFTEKDIFFTETNKEGDDKLKVKSFSIIEIIDLLNESKEENNIFFEDIFVREEAVKILKKLGVY